MWETGNAYRISLGESKGKILFWKSRCSWDDNVKKILKELNVEMRTRLIWLSAGSSSWLLWTPNWNCSLYRIKRALCIGWANVSFSKNNLLRSISVCLLRFMTEYYYPALILQVITTGVLQVMPFWVSTLSICCLTLTLRSSASPLPSFLLVHLASRLP